MMPVGAIIAIFTDIVLLEEVPTCVPSRVKVLRNPAEIFCRIVFENCHNGELTKVRTVPLLMLQTHPEGRLDYVAMNE
jgi:hypothetical protein